MTHIDAGLAIIRIATGVVIFMHGWNHLFGGGRVPGAARWYASMGLKPGMFHAWMSVVCEAGGGALFAFGLVTPLAGAMIVGLMAVAGIVVHRPHGFFIFKEGYEYVLYLAVVAVGIGVTGPGKFSLDHAIGIDKHFHGWPGGLFTGLAGLVGAGLLLALFWRPEKETATA